MLRYLAVALILSSWSSLAGAVDVTTCDQLVPAGQVGEVLEDLDCSGGPFFGVSLGAGATLHLNGHRLNGPTAGGAIIYALKSATVVGPGEIDTSPEGACILASNGSLIVDGGATGIDIHGCSDGIDVQHSASIANVTVHDNAFAGIFAVHLKVTNVSSSGNKLGLIGDISVKARSVVVSGNSYGGINADKIVSLIDSTVDGSGVYGVDGNRGQVSLSNSVVSNSGGLGILAKSVRLRDSSATGTGAVPNNSYPPNIDLLTEKTPKLHNSTCGKSWGKRPPHHPTGPAATWGVCTND
jgi:hypothetical protein